VIVLTGVLVGMSQRFVRARLRFDAANPSALLVNTASDAAGVPIYFTIATPLLPVCSA
jgi:magnesium transporter